MLEDALSKLADLYTKTGMDWDIEIHHCLTEPTCPTVVINPVGLTANRYRVDRDTIEEGVEDAVSRVYAEIIEGKEVELMCPTTNPDDATLAAWVEKWKRGEALTDVDFL